MNVFLLYWIIAGTALFMQPSTKAYKNPFIVASALFVICMTIGGIVTPAKYVAKRIR